MTMDLWYDLAARELPDVSGEVIEKLEGVHVAQDAPEPEPDALVAVDFF